MSPNFRITMSNQGKIYCAHCIFTGKKYIGQTRKKLLCNRIASHFVDANKGYRKSKFHHALKKYGRCGFIWGIIEECEISMLNNNEIYWISYHNTVSNGYNLSPGGGQPTEYSCKEYLVEEPNGQRKIIKNLSKYCRDNNLNVGHVHATLYGKRIHNKGYKLIPRTDKEIEKYNNERKIREDSSKKGHPGEKNCKAILNWNKVFEIRRLHKDKKYKNQEIADMFEIKLSTLEKVIGNKTWTVLKATT